MTLRSARHRHASSLATPLLAVALGLAVIAVIAAPARDAAAQADPRAAAKDHYARGKRAFEQGAYQDAIKEFRAADQLAPSGVNDFNIALAYDALGQPTEAIRHYRAYLTRVPDAPNRSQVEASIERLEAAIRVEEQRRLEEAAAARAKAEEEARLKAEAEEARRRAEEAARQPPPGDGSVAPPGDGAGAGPVAPPPAPTGDPELDRVAAIDVAAIRDQRAATAPPVTAASTTGAPPPDGGAPAAPTPVDQEPKKAKPIYKQWWFWVVAGVSAYVLISILAADSDEAQPGTRGLMMPSPAPAPAGGGWTLMRF